MIEVFCPYCYMNASYVHQSLFQAKVTYCVSVCSYSVHAQGSCLCLIQRKVLLSLLKFEDLVLAYVVGNVNNMDRKKT